MDNRDELIEAYFNALDTNSFEDLRSVVEEEVTFRPPDGSHVIGVSEMIQYFENNRDLDESNHRILTRVDDEATTVCEGDVTGRIGDEEVEAEYCDVFEFGEEKISRISVYVRDS